MNKRVYVMLKGGLGNQLFQYSFAEYLGSRGITVAGFYPAYANDAFKRRLLLEELFGGALATVGSLPAGTVLVQSEDPSRILEFIANSRHEHYLIEGYFQDVRIVSDCRWVERLPVVETGPVKAAIHVRRSDYGHHGLLPVNYYRAGLRTLGDPPFRVFTDEPNFARHAFGSVPGFTEVVPPDPDQPIREFLALASHQAIVIANSTYSWMSAWVASRRGRMQVAYPAEWSLLSASPGGMPGWNRIETILARP